MKKDHFFLLTELFIALLFILLTTPSVTAQTAVAPSGSGTIADPYLIATLDNLYWITQNSSQWTAGKVYKQTADINASATSGWDGGKGFSPIGNNLTTSIYFTGSYNGQSYAISNLFINRTNTGLNLAATVGLFGYAVNATITNVKLVTVNITGDSDYGSAYVGALAGCSQSTTISNCSSTGSVTSPMKWAALGGLIGTEQVGSSTTNCYSSCIVTGTGSNADVGCLVGQLWYSSTISSSYSTGAVSSTNNNVGDLIGAIDDVTSVSYGPSSILNCYSTGSVSGGSYAGGLVGYTGKTNTTVTNCYSTGSVSSGSGSRGGLIGSNTGIVTNCFWDKTTSGQSTSNGGTGKTTTEMKTPSTFVSAGWDGSIWNIGDGLNDGYPYFDWENPLGTPITGSSGQWTKAGLSGKSIYTIESDGKSMFLGTDGSGIYKGNGNDSNWVNANVGMASSSILCIKSYSGFLYAGTSGGVFRSDDSAQTWTIKNAGLTSTFVRTIDLSGTLIFAGTEGGGIFKSFDNASTWNQLSMSPTASTIRTIIINNGCYAGTSSGGIFFSSDGGSTWSAKNGGLTDLFIRALAFVGANLFAGTPSGVFKSTDLGNSWSLVNTGLAYTSVETFAVSGTTLYAGTGGGGVFKTTNDGAQWKEFNTGLIGSTNLDVRTLFCTQTNIYAGTLGGGLYKAAITDSLPSTNGLIAYYPFNGNANDESGNSNHGIVYTAALTSDRFGNSNKAYSFNGQTDYISSTNQITNPFPISISLWFKTTTTNGGKLFGFGESQTGSSTNHDRNIYITNSGKIYFGVWPGSYQVLKSVNSYNDGNWHHVVGIVSAQGLMLYIDNSLAGHDYSVTSAQNFTGYWRIGYDNLALWPDEPTSRFIAGLIDDIRIYNRPLADLEISVLYNENTVGIKDEKSATPGLFSLEQNYPNPFNPSTTIKYTLAFDSKVLIKIYNVLGQEVRLLKDEIISAGEYEVKFNSSSLPSGVYFYRLNADPHNGGQKYSSIKKMMLLK